ncbi:hypothetical protein CRYUN_Cryun05aG0267200 [Craigia yunnanensis]
MKGWFFKNLTERKPIYKAKAKEEAEKIKEITKEKAGSKTRRNIYLALIALLTFLSEAEKIEKTDEKK